MTDPHVSMGKWLQRVLARNSVGSRHTREGLITQGKVDVDGHVVHELGTHVDPVASIIHVDGIRVQADSSLLTPALCKPPGVVSTMYNDVGRPGLAQYVEDRPERLHHVGQLDQNTEGLILLSDDGKLAHRLTHPKYEVPKTYIAHVESSIARGLGKALEHGITLEDSPAHVGRFILCKSAPRSSIVEIILHPGRDHVMRRMMAKVDYPVVELVHMKFGMVIVGHLKPGKTHVVAGGELDTFMKLADL